MGDDHCSVVHLLIGWWAEGVPDIGFSLCTAPTYCQVSEYFRLKSQGSGLMPKDVQQRRGHHARQCHKFLGFGVQFWAEPPKGSEVVCRVLAMNRVVHVLRVDLQDV